MLRPETRDGLLAIVAQMKARDGIDAVILGGTELPLILRDPTASDIPLLDTTVIHAKAIVGARRCSDMALTATIYNFDIELADSDRHVYESLNLRVARHPSESEEYLVTRLLAYLLEYAEGHRVLARRVGPRRSGDCDPRSDRARSPPGSTSARPTPRACTRPPSPARASSSTRTRTPISS